ncbi:MAG: alpha/beta fold hydrolase [Pirellulaceae bacterium]|nr:alpha/beta fold hydrolase [Pirellulaceae bacterium]
MLLGNTFATRLCAILFLLLCPALALAQAAEEDKIPEPEDVTLETKDGVQIRATWYAGTLKKKAVPIIMIHGWEGQRGEYDALARGLQSLGYAVICPDLRGHGQSTTVRLADGTPKEIKHETLRQAEIAGMVLDVEACKKFLMEKNNLGELNIEQLCVIGAEFGCVVALNWALADWSAPVLPAYKQGQDVKALVLLSPVRSFKGITTRDALSHPIIRGKLSTMIVAGKQNAKSYNEARQLHSSMETFHVKVSDDPEEQREKLDLFFIKPETSLEGTKLLANALKVPNNIANFIKLRLVDKADELTWSERRNPLK